MFRNFTNFIKALNCFACKAKLDLGMNTIAKCIIQRVLSAMLSSVMTTNIIMFRTMVDRPVLED